MLGLQLLAFDASTAAEIDAAFARLASERADALFVVIDQYFDTQREQFAALTKRDKIPTAYGNRDLVAAGGLMSYGTDFAETFHQIGAYAGRILKGAKPDELPVQQSTKFEFVLNLKIAHALHIEVPP